MCIEYGLKSQIKSGALSQPLSHMLWNCVTQYATVTITQPAYLLMWVTWHPVAASWFLNAFLIFNDYIHYVVTSSNCCPSSTLTCFLLCKYVHEVCGSDSIIQSTIFLDKKCLELLSQLLLKNFSSTNYKMKTRQGDWWRETGGKLSLRYLIQYLEISKYRLSNCNNKQ